MAVIYYDINYVKGDSHQIQVTEVGEVDRMYMTVKDTSNLVKIQKKYYLDPRAGTSNDIELQEDGSYIITLNPSDTDYVYFYAEITTGKLHFAKTYREFQNLIQKYS